MALGSDGNFHMEDCCYFRDCTGNTDFVTCDCLLEKVQIISFHIDELTTYPCPFFLHHVFWYSVLAHMMYPQIVIEVGVATAT
jgi:hypothetical protein